MEELKGCPLDDSENVKVLEHRGRPFFTIECGDCGLSIFGDEKLALIARWNDRPAQTATDARIRVLEATVSVQRMGLEKAANLIAEFGGSDNLLNVATDVNNWIEYGLSTPPIEAYENRTRGLVDLLIAVQGYLYRVQSEEGFLNAGAEAWTMDGARMLGAQIQTMIQELPPLLRGSVCKLTLGCPERHTADCRREFETRSAAYSQAGQIAEQIITNATAALGVAVPQTARDLQFFAELMAVISFTHAGKDEEKGRTWISYAGGLLGLDAPSLEVLSRYAKIKPQPAAEVIETEEGGKPS